MEDPNVSPIKRRRKDVHMKQALEGLDEGFNFDQIHETVRPTGHHCILTDKVNSVTYTNFDNHI